MYLRCTGDDAPNRTCVDRGPSWVMRELPCLLLLPVCDAISSAILCPWKRIADTAPYLRPRAAKQASRAMPIVEFLAMNQARAASPV